MPEQESPPSAGPEEPPRSHRLTRAGVLLLGLSLLLWLLLPAVPFLPLSGPKQAALGGGLLVGAEIAFWVGAALAGPGAARRMRDWIYRWVAKLWTKPEPPA